MASVLKIENADQGLQTYGNWPADAKVTKYALNSAGFIYTGEDFNVKCQHCHVKTQINDSIPSLNLVNHHKDDCKFVREKFPNRTRFSGAQLRIKSERLKTFEGWPLDFISPEKLAEAGLFYMKLADHTQCVYCRGRLGQWEMGDDPMTEHRRYFPTCPFVEKQTV